MSARRNLTAEFKANVVLELISGEKGLTQARQEYVIIDAVLSLFCVRACETELE